MSDKQKQKILSSGNVSGVFTLEMNQNDRSN